MAKLAKKAKPESNSKLIKNTSSSTKEVVRKQNKRSTGENLSSEQLEAEIQRLRGLLAKAEAKAEGFDSKSVLATRARFMELAGAEFNRANRYGAMTGLLDDAVALTQAILWANTAANLWKVIGRTG